MTDVNAAEHFDDQLLSAYIDGELTDDERALVEERLANDPQAQLLVGELRALSHEVQSLPREAVGDDLRTTIMQRAERAMLLGETRVTPPDGPRTVSSRRWAWAAAALAATLLLSIYLPRDREPDKPLASAKPVPAEPRSRDLQLRALGGREQDIDRGDADTRPEAEGFVAEMPGAKLEAGDEGAAGIDAVVADSLPNDNRFRQAQRKALSDSASEAIIPPARQSSAAREGEKQSDFNAKQDRRWFGLSCEVHITLRDDDQSVHRFDEMLSQSGIAFDEFDQQTPKDGLLPAVGDQKERRRLPANQSDLTDPSKKLVLVEAPIENIENALRKCNLDTFTCPSIRVVADHTSTTPEVRRLQQWSRNGQQVAARGAISSRPAQEALVTGGEAPTLGRATRLRSEDFGQSLLRNEGRNKPGGKTPLQILFVLQRATVETQSDVQPAAASPAKR